MGGVHSSAVFQFYQVVFYAQQVVTGREEVAGIQHALIRDGSMEPVQGGGYPVGGFLVQVGIDPVAGPVYCGHRHGEYRDPACHQDDAG